MDATFDFVIIGAGPAGEAAANKARELGASVAIIDQRWFGGSCPHIGCVPSKALLEQRRAARGEPGDLRLGRARRRVATTWSNRAPEADEPDDAGHVRALEAAGAVVYRGTARITAVGRVVVSPTTGPRMRSAPGTSWSRSARVSKVPPIDGIDVDPDLDQSRGDARPHAAGEPARPRRRPDRLRARPGLRAIRRPDDDRPIRVHGSLRPTIPATRRPCAPPSSATA